MSATEPKEVATDAPERESKWIPARGELPVLIDAHMPWETDVPRFYCARPRTMAASLALDATMSAALAGPDDFGQMALAAMAHVVRDVVGHPRFTARAGGEADDAFAARFTAFFAEEDICLPDVFVAYKKTVAPSAEGARGADFRR